MCIVFSILRFLGLEKFKVYIDLRTNIPLSIYSAKKAASEKAAAESKLAEELAGMNCVFDFLVLRN